MIEAHCARCHQADRLTAARPDSLLLNILTLDEIARDPSLVRPGVADASPLYTVMLRQAMPPAAAEGAAAKAGPSDDDIQAIRDWINGLAPASRAQCTHGAPAGDLIATHLSRLPSAERADARFIVLPCALRSLAADQRETVQRLTQHLARPGSAATIEQIVPVDPANSVFRISLKSIGMTASDWEQLVASYPDRMLPASPAAKLASGVTLSAVPAVRGDWLAHVIVRGRGAMTGTEPASDALIRLAPLARAWERAVDLETAVAEMSLEPLQLAQRLAEVQGPNHIAARRLLQGLLPRSEFQALRNSLAGSADTPTDPSTGTSTTPSTGEPFAFAIWSDKTSYAVGDLLTLNASTSADCHLTLIGLDGQGQATVLFPNEMASDNLIRAGSIANVPAAEAAYRFRLEDPRTETVIGVCTVHAKIADNIQQDFDRQRFTLLGDWRAFLSRTWKQTSAQSSRPKEERRRRQSRAARNTPSAPAQSERPKPGEHVRTAITFEVK